VNALVLSAWTTEPEIHLRFP